MWKLYKDQRKLLNRLWTSLQIHERVLFQSQTGSGKTVMASALIAELVKRGERVAFIVDRSELVSQSIKTFGVDNVSVVKAGFEREFDTEKPVQVIMIQTFYARRAKLPDMDLSYIFIDEVHNNWNSGRINELLKIYSDCKVVGLSATPIDSKGWLLNGFDDYVEGLQGRELIELGRLCPTIDYSFESYKLDLSQVSIVNGDYSIDEVDQQTLDIDNVKMIVDEWERLAANRKTLVFGNSIKHATALWREFVKRGHKFELLHSQNNNRSALDRLRTPATQGVVNVGITVAGFDYPLISCIVNARVTKIERVARQIIGRGRRVANGKVDNIHLDFANYIQNFGNTDDDRYYSFKPVKNNEGKYKQCPECGNIEPVEAKECSICGYSFEYEMEQQASGVSKPKPKKELERLVKIKSMQDELYNSLVGLVVARGYKRGYAYHLFKDLLMNAKAQGTGIRFYSKLMNRIDKCIARSYNPRWLLHQ